MIHGDTSKTLFCGDVSEPIKRLVKVTEECFDYGISVCKDGALFGKIGKRIRTGIATVFHSKPLIYHHRDMQGLGKKDVKVSVEQNILIIKGECKKEYEDDDEGGRKVSSRIDFLPEKAYKLSEIKGEMKNGVLKVVPKMKEEERTDVVNIKVEKCFW